MKAVRNWGCRYQTRYKNLCNEGQIIDRVEPKQRQIEVEDKGGGIADIEKVREIGFIRQHLIGAGKWDLGLEWE